MSNTLLVEKYRPSNLDNYIGNEHLRDKVEQYIETGDIPHLLFYGKAGTGKTTLAKLLTKNIDCDLLYVNASDVRRVDDLIPKIKSFATTVGFKDLKIVILDEVDYISSHSQAAFTNIMVLFI